MNDFTKEELIILKNGVDWLPNSVNLSLDYLEKCKALFRKIDGLIVNYCEHESKIDIEEAPMICQKCGKVTG